MVLGPAAEDDRARAIGEDERHEPAVAARMLAVVRVRLGGEVPRRAVARHHERSRRRLRDEVRRGGPPRGGQSGAAEVVVDEVGVAPQPELGGQVSQVVLARDRVGSRGDVHEHVDVAGIGVGILERRASGAKREIAVVEASVRSAALAACVEVEVEAAFDDTDVSFDPLGFEQPPVGTGGTHAIEDLSIRHPMLGHERPRSRQRNRDICTQRGDHRSVHRALLTNRSNRPRPTGPCRRRRGQ